LTREARRLIAFISIAMVVDTAAYATITPLLPRLAHHYHLSKAGAGALSASYPLGTLVLSLPAGVLASRLGPRRTVLLALGVLAGASLLFGLAQSAALLTAARTIQGFGAAAVWAGGLAWVVAVAPRDRRAEAIGAAIGAAIAGALGGPILGALAATVGRAVVFAAFVALPAALIVALARLPGPESVATPNARALFRDPRARMGILLMAMPSSIFGLVNVLVPLRLDRFGAGAAAIAAVFLAAVVLEATMSPIAGRMADRRGPLAPARIGLLAGAAGLALLPLPGDVVLLGAAVVLACGLLGLVWAPAMSLLGEAADRNQLNPAFAFGVGNLAWGAGTAFGGSAGGAVAAAAGDAVPYLALAAAAAAIALSVRPPDRRSGSRRSSRPRSSASARSPGP
jgi:DHA1 family solute carrier family 18 vesicular amine transporter 1/2